MSKHIHLTKRQREILSYIYKRIDEGLPPTYREIADHFGIKSNNGVTCHLRALETKGAITIDRRLARGIRIA